MFEKMNCIKSEKNGHVALCSDICIDSMLWYLAWTLETGNLSGAVIICNACFVPGQLQVLHVRSAAPLDEIDSCLNSTLKIRTHIFCLSYSSK